MHPLILGLLIIAAAVSATVALGARARSRPRGLRGHVVEIIDRRKVALMVRGRRCEVVTARGLPISVGDDVRLSRRPGLFGITLIPMRLRRDL